MLIIGIAGGTGSGKTTVAKKIIRNLQKDNVILLSQDSYYKDSSDVPPEERQSINFDHPDAFDWDLLYRQVLQLLKGKSIEQPVYDFITSTRLSETIHVLQAETVIYHRLF